MPLRNCPVCRVGKIRRKDIKTCGAPDCVEIWRAMTSSQRARAIEEADASSSDVGFSALPSPTFDRQRSAIPSEAPAPDSTTKRDNEALRKLFGEENPPGAVPIKSDDDEGER